MCDLLAHRVRHPGRLPEQCRGTDADTTRRADGGADRNATADDDASAEDTDANCRPDAPAPFADRDTRADHAASTNGGKARRAG